MLTYRLREKTTAVVLHDSHTPPEQSAVQHFLAVGGRQRGLLDIGYHFLILRDGKLVECRPHAVQGTHLRSKHNRDTIGVCLAGGRTADRYCMRCGDKERAREANCLEPDQCDLQHEPEDNFTPAQWATFQDLMSVLDKMYSPPLPVIGHAELDPRHPGQCPCTDMTLVRKRLTRRNTTE